jgi:hypothetical protein
LLWIDKVPKTVSERNYFLLYVQYNEKTNTFFKNNFLESDNEVAPAWFVQWMQQGQQQRQQQEEQFNYLNSRISNSTALLLDDELIPPRVVGNAVVPAEFPRTVNEILTLEDGSLLTQIENYYNLPHNGDINTRRRKVRREYGVGLILLN